jgi:signal transduction histidine kinase
MGGNGDGNIQGLRDSEQMERVAKLLGEVCHELFQPMQTISGYSELLLMGLQKEHPHYGNLKKIKEHVDRMILITRKLIDIRDIARKKTSAPHAGG